MNYPERCTPKKGVPVRIYRDMPLGCNAIFRETIPRFRCIPTTCRSYALEPAGVHLGLSQKWATKGSQILKITHILHLIWVRIHFQQPLCRVAELLRSGKSPGLIGKILGSKMLKNFRCQPGLVATFCEKIGDPLKKESFTTRGSNN